MPYVTSGKLKIRYDFLKSNEDASIVAFFNGSMSTLETWKSYADLLHRSNYSVLVHDYRCQGGSDHQEEKLSFDQHAEDFLNILKSLDLGKVHIVAASYGCLAAMTFAAAFPEKVSSLTFIDGLSQMDRRTSLWVQNFISWARAAGQDAKHKDVYFDSVLPLFYSTEFLQNARDLLSTRRAAFEKSPDKFFHGLAQIYQNQIENLPLTGKLVSIKVPSMVIWAENDILTPRELSESMVDAITDCEFITIPRSGHVSIVEREKEISTILLGFLTKQSVVARTH